MKAVHSLLLAFVFITAINSQFLSLNDIKPLTFQSVSTLDLNRVNGTWYSIASTSSIVEAGCHCQRTTYALQQDGSTILNTDACRLFSDNGYVLHSPSSTMTPTDSTRLHWESTSLGGWVSADYNFLAVDPDYNWVLTTSKNGTYSWVLSKNKSLDSTLLDSIKKIGTDAGVNVKWDLHGQACPDFS